MQKPEIQELSYYGTEYGGWFVPAHFINPESICYLVGVGEDISFDLALIEHCKCDVYAFDPTPRAEKYIQHIENLPLEYHFYTYGLWCKNERIRFYAPASDEHVSHSILNLQNTNKFFEAECKTLSSIMSELGHQNIDLLKIDIEGAEYDVLDQILQENLRVTVLCVEFHENRNALQIRKDSTITKILEAGYHLIKVKQHDYTFVKE